jgi:Family of unknown function (DUF5343)
MALTSTYLVTTKNLEAFLNAIATAQAPERFTQTFLKNLEFSSSNDRLYIGLLKSLNFIDDSGIPQQRYFDFLDQTESKRVLAAAIHDAYEDLFKVNKNAQKLTEDEVKNKLKTLTRGEKSENVIGWMAKTFKALCEYADWSHSSKDVSSKSSPVDHQEQASLTHHVDLTKPSANDSSQSKRPAPLGLHYNIQIHLPATRDSAIYDAIFKSLKEHIL